MIPSALRHMGPRTFSIIGLALFSGCVFFHGQRYHHFTTQPPVGDNHFLILGFLGGRDTWDNPKSGVRKLALKLQALSPSTVHVETVENRKRHLAMQLIGHFFDRNQDARLDEQERAAVRLILYGESFGGAAVVKLARQLKEIGVPVLLTVQIDSVGRGDKIIPANVARAANLFQRNGWLIRGEPAIRPEDPNKTTIIGNFQFDYRDKKVDLSGLSWMKTIFRKAHAKMGLDPDVWGTVEKIILDALRESRLQQKTRLEEPLRSQEDIDFRQQLSREG